MRGKREGERKRERGRDSTIELNCSTPHYYLSVCTKVVVTD